MGADGRRACGTPFRRCPPHVRSRNSLKMRSFPNLSLSAMAAAERGGSIDSATDAIDAALFGGRFFGAAAA
jgi:hypothetical protein